MSEEKKQWKREISAGGIVYKIGDGPAAAKASAGRQIFVLLIQPSGKTANKDKVWTFPKGHIDNDEPEEAAIREVKEEGGVEAKIIEKLGSIKYPFVWDNENIFKIVTFYLMEYVSGDPKDHDFEVAEAKWFALAEAEKMLSYNTDKEVFEKAKKFLK